MRATAVLYVGDVDRMQAFYQLCFQLQVLDTGPGYVGLASDSWLITLVRSAEAPPIASPPRRRADTPVKLAFDVASIAGLRPHVSALGGEVSPVETEWTFRDAIHCDCLDPEGNVVQLIQG